jgi:hypothetical protein
VSRRLREASFQVVEAHSVVVPLAIDGLPSQIDAPGLIPIYRELEAALDTAMTPPPAHVTLYSTDPASGIGIDDEAQLAERAPELAPAEQAEIMAAMRFELVFG